MIDVKNLSKSFGDHLVLDDISAHISPGEKVVVIGPSGSGKSTFLRCLNLLETPTKGTITFEGTDITDPKTDINLVRRQMGMVFQHFNLLMQRTVLGNVCFPLEIVGMSRKDAKKRAMEVLKLVGIADKANAYPSQLSGGMQRRAELVRAMINQPKVMMMDEPFRGLDAMTRALMQEYYVRLFEEHRGTNLFVTSELEEGIFLADRLVVLTNQPCQVKKVMDVNLPRPRTFDMMAMPEYVDIKREVLELLHDEAMKSFATGAVNAADFLEAYSQLGQDQAQPRMEGHK